jgi:hypothetical protein
MSNKQLVYVFFKVGETVKHSTTGREGVVIGAKPSKRGKGVWLCVMDDNGTWHQYVRCAR